MNWINALWFIPKIEKVVKLLNKDKIYGVMKNDHKTLLYINLKFRQPHFLLEQNKYIFPP